MQFEEACRLINSTYVLTQGEKATFIQMARNGDPNLRNILDRFKHSRNVHAFYDDLKKNNLLSSGSYQDLLQTKNTSPHAQRIRSPLKQNFERNHANIQPSHHSPNPTMTKQPIQKVGARSPSPLLNRNFNQPSNSGGGGQNKFSLISPANTPQELQKLLSHLPLHTIPLHSILKQFCNEGPCDFQKFKNEVKTLLPHVPNTDNQKLLEVVYNSLDKNHDGKIDVNELSNNMIVFYNPQSYKKDADSWSKISQVNWAPVNNVRSYLQSLGLNPNLVKNLIEKVNIENNPNMSFAQYLRAKNDSVRSEVDQVLINVPRSRSASHSPIIQRRTTRSNIENISPQRVERIVTQQPIRTSTSPVKPGTVSPHGMRQPRNSGSRRVNTIIMQQSPIKSNTVLSPGRVTTQIVRPQIGAPGMRLSQSKSRVVTPYSPLRTSPRSIIRSSSPFQNKQHAKIVKTEFIQSPDSPIEHVNSPKQSQRLLIKSPNSPLNRSIHHTNLNKPSTQTFNISQSPSPKKGHFSSITSNCCINPCNEYQPVLIKASQVKADGRLISPIRQPMRVYTTTRRTQDGRLVTTTTKSPSINENPISQPIFQASNRNKQISPISPTLQRIQVGTNPKYRKVVVGAHGKLSQSNLNNYQSPNKDGSIPRKYQNQPQSRNPHSKNPPIRIRDNRTAQNDRTPSPHHTKPQNNLTQNQNRSVSPNERTLVKGQYQSIQNAGNDPQNAQNTQNSNLSFGNNTLKNFNDSDNKSKPSTPHGKTTTQQHVEYGGKNRTPSQSPEMRTKEDLQKLLENTNTPSRSPAINSKVSYTPPKIPGVTVPLEDGNNGGGNIFAPQNGSSGQNAPGNLNNVQNGQNQSVPGAQNTQRAQNQQKNDQENRGIINPQDEVLVKGFDRSNLPGKQRSQQGQQTPNKSPDQAPGGQNLAPQTQNISKIPKSESPIKSRDQKAPMAPTLQNLLALRIPLGLNTIPASRITKKLKNQFKNHPSKKSFSKPKFVEFIKSLEADDNLTNQELENYCGQLFDGLDFDKNGKLSRTEIANFMILNSQGDKKSKIEAAFDLYDRNGNQKLDRGELTDYFLGVIKLSTIGKNFTAKQAQNLSAATAKKCFDKIDLNNDGSIGLNEFTEYILNGGDASASQVAMQEHQRQTMRMSKKPRFTKQRNQREQNIHDVKKVMDRIRQGVPFQKIHISVALHYLKQDNPELYTIDKMKFRNFLKNLINKQKISVKFRDGFDNIPALFFKVFDINNNGILDKQELGVGLFILCGGSVKEKLRYIGQIYSTQSPGFINRDELLLFFENFYRFALFGKGESARGGYSEREYGVRMVKHVFAKYGARAYPGISVGQFASLEKSDFMQGWILENF